MPQVNYAEDIVPLSSFRSEMTRLMSQTRQTHRPIVVTQNGRASNVFLDVGDYQALIDKLDIGSDLDVGTCELIHQIDGVLELIANSHVCLRVVLVLRRILEHLNVVTLENHADLR